MLTMMARSAPAAARLRIRLLGPFEVTIDGDPVTTFETDSDRALLAFLAAEPGRRHPRPVVAEMLWPERPEGAALSNLRHALSVLRRALGDGDTEQPFLDADRHSVALCASEVWVDLVEFERLAGTSPGAGGAVEAWEQAVDLWRGQPLEGLRVRAGAEWDEWVVVIGERARRELTTVLLRLSEHHEREGTWDLALPLARRLTEVDPWEERAHRRLMRLLAQLGRSGEALSHVQGFRERLRAELGAEPAPETVALADQIRAGDLAGATPDVDVVYPAFLIDTPRIAPSLFVGRATELERLDDQLRDALAGRGRTVLVAGEAGSGKTMLAAEFMRRAMEEPDLLVARGRCSAFEGVGDPYLPFRELFSLLCGDVESPYTAGALDREQATRLWEVIPHSSRLVSGVAPSLVGILVNGPLLVERVEQAVPGAGWLDRLRDRVERLAALPPVAERQQPALFDDFTAVLERLSLARPLVLVVDDLQWADTGSIALLWHLARRIEAMRILLIGLYRPEEVEARPEGIPSLDLVVRDLQARSPECIIELPNDPAFVDEFLDSEPNALGRGFRDRLLSCTGGHPLFTVEVIRGMQDRAEIRRDRSGVWRAGESLDWDRMPSRVEAVIAQRMARLPDDLRADLEVASVQGEEFVAEIVGAVRSDPTAPARLSRESGVGSRMVVPTGVSRIGDRLAARHRFRHVLFQRYLYEQIGPAERSRLHEATGRALEELYADHPEPPVVDLARHFDAAGLVEPAAAYLSRAGQRAIRMSASEDAIPLLERARTVLGSLPTSTERDRRELDLLGWLMSSLMAVRGYASPEAQAIGPRIRELCGRLGPSPATASALIGLASMESVRGLYPSSQSTCREALAMVDELGDRALRVLGLRILGYNQTLMGDLAGGHESLQAVERLYDPEAHAWLMYVLAGAPLPEALVWDAFNTVSRGYPAEAIGLADRGIGLARELGHPFTLCHTLAVGGFIVRYLAGDYQTARTFVDEVEAIATTEHFPFYSIAAQLYRGQVTGRLGNLEGGIELITTALEAWQAIGVGAFRGWFLGDVAEFEVARGNTVRGLEVIEDALVHTRDVSEGLAEVNLLVQRGELLGEIGTDAAAAGLVGAIDAARAIGARLLELRAATELARLHERRGEPRRADEVLRPVYSRFTEGFDTPHLVAARAVLDRL